MDNTQKNETRDNKCHKKRLAFSNSNVSKDVRHYIRHKINEIVRGFLTGCNSLMILTIVKIIGL